jgi:hypothetical protein
MYVEAKQLMKFVVVKPLNGTLNANSFFICLLFFFRLFLFRVLIQNPHNLISAPRKLSELADDFGAFFRVLQNGERDVEAAAERNSYAAIGQERPEECTSAGV